MSWLQRIAEQPESLESLIQKWRLAVPGIILFVFEKDNIIVLSSLIIPRGNRKQGIGSQIMQDLIQYADQVGKRLETTPGQKDPYHGTTSRGRLINFYKRFGLRENKGRHKDYQTSETMYREPKERL
jgi:GNAT superfamily N-acetyltransferase